MNWMAALLASAVVSPLAFTANAEASDADPWFAHDKYLHGSVSAGLSLTGYGLASLATHDLRWRFGTGVTLALAAGIGKELVDLHGPGDASWRDFTWDVAGTASGVVIAYVLDTYVF